jgi:hypothetical protein
MLTPPNILSDKALSLWQVMQRIEHCRHRAELAENRGRAGSQAFRAEMAEIARQWVELAREIEQLETDPLSDPP